MKTLEAITEIFKVLERMDVDVDHAPHILDMTKQFILLTRQMQETEPSVTPAKVLAEAQAAERRRKVTLKG